MAPIFISHSRADNNAARDVRDALIARGWAENDLFLDLTDVRLGERWQDVLRGQIEQCHVVVVYLSDAWPEDAGARTEFYMAEQLGKRIIALIEAPLTKPLNSSITDMQIANDVEELSAALRRSGLNPHSFHWPPPDEPRREPYRGLAALEEQDAAIFFGRDADITRGLDQVRALHSANPGMLVLLGARGVGKSSFLRAGLLARLKRDPAFFCLPTLRFGGGRSVSELVHEMLGARLPATATKEIVDAALATMLEEPRSNKGERAPTLIWPIDQLELGLDAPNLEPLLTFIAEAARKGVALLCALRSEAHERLAHERAFREIPQSLFNLSPLPVGALAQVIERPGMLASPPLEFDPVVTERLLADCQDPQALPLLALALQQLYRRHALAGRLTLGDYEAHVLDGAIEAAVETAIGHSEEKLAVARRAFIPSLVRVDANGPRRRVAQIGEFSPDAREIIEALVASSLLVRDGETIAIASEALFVQWPALRSWVSQDYETLRVLDIIRDDAGEWDRGRRNDELLVHRGERLAQAEAVLARVELRIVLTPVEAQYLAECRKLEAAVRKSGQRRRNQPALPYAPKPRGGKVFISYRRADTKGLAKRLHNRLDQDFAGDVFLDVDLIPTGANFKAHIDGYLSQCAVILVVMGKSWRNPKWGRRPLWGKPKEDYVEMEVALAFELGLPIIPILVDGASMPAPARLPAAMAELSLLNALKLGSGASFHDDTDFLVGKIRSLRA